MIAKESRDGWIILAVFDPEAKLSTRSDYVLGADRRGLRVLYRSSGESYAFFVGGGAGGAGIGGTDISGQQISYARFEYEMLFQRPSGPDTKTKTEDHQASWLKVAGKPIPAPSFIRGITFPPLFWVEPLDRRFTVNGASGDIEGLVRAYQIIMNDGLKKIDGTGLTDHPWVEVRFNGDRWLLPIEIVAADDLPDPGFRWYYDREALIRSDVHGNDHVLLERSSPGFWTASFEICYFTKTDAGWSAPIVLGTNVPSNSHRDLALDDKGNAFAVWIDKNDAVKGRWILHQK